MAQVDPHNVPPGRRHYHFYSLEEKTKIQKPRDLSQIYMRRKRLDLSPAKKAQGCGEGEDSEDGTKTGPMYLGMSESHYD